MKISFNQIILLFALPALTSAAGGGIRGKLRSLAAAVTVYRTNWALDSTESTPITFDQIDPSCLQTTYNLCVFVDRQPFVMAWAEEPNPSNCPMVAFHQDISGPVMIPVTKAEYDSIKNSTIYLPGHRTLSQIKTVYDMAPKVVSKNQDGSIDYASLFVSSGSFFRNMLRNLDLPLTVDIVNYAIANMVESKAAEFTRSMTTPQDFTSLGLQFTEKEFHDDQFLISSLVWYVVLNFSW